MGDPASAFKRRIVARALFFNDRNEMLLVKPTGRLEWTIPGGSAEANETPSAACRREVRQVLGINVQVGHVLCVEYQCARGAQPETLQFIFDGGRLGGSQVEQIRLPQQDIAEFQFCGRNKAMILLGPNLTLFIKAALGALEQTRIVYFEDGRER